MGLMWECDRCGKLETGAMVEVKVPHLRFNSYDEVDSNYTYTRCLCFSCHKQLVAFVNRLPKEQ